jgi:hypothetical protein
VPETPRGAGYRLASARQPPVAARRNETLTHIPTKMKGTSAGTQAGTGEGFICCLVDPPELRGAGTRDGLTQLDNTII